MEFSIIWCYKGRSYKTRLNKVCSLSLCTTKNLDNLCCCDNINGTELWLHVQILNWTPPLTSSCLKYTLKNSLYIVSEVVGSDTIGTTVLN